jgi:anti-sigma factor RsiW
MSSRDLLPDHPAELTLLEYLVGDLPDETSDRIRRHVAACRACRRTIADLSLTVDELDRLPTVHRPHEVPVPLEELPGPRPFRAARILTIVAVLVAAVGVAVVLRLNEPSGPPPRTTRFFLRLPARPAAVEIAIRDALPATAQPRVSFTQGKPVSVVVNVAKGDLDATLRDLPQMPPTRNGRYWTVDVGVVERASLRPPRVPDAVPVVGTP